MVDLVPVLKIESAEEGDEVVKYGEQGDRFYIILKGSVSVLVPNSKIHGWRSLRFNFKQNVEWKKEKDRKYQEIKIQELVKKQKAIIKR